MEAPRHSQEPARLAALRALDILDTAPERDFDDAVALAAVDLPAGPVWEPSLIVIGVHRLTRRDRADVDEAFDLSRRVPRP